MEEYESLPSLPQAPYKRSSQSQCLTVAINSALFPLFENPKTRRYFCCAYCMIWR